MHLTGNLLFNISLLLLLVFELVFLVELSHHVRLLHLHLGPFFQLFVLAFYQNGVIHIAVGWRHRTLDDPLLLAQFRLQLLLE